MRLKTQFRLTLAIFSVLLIAIAASIVSTSQQISNVRIQETLTTGIVLDASDLAYISNDYIIYHGDQQLSQWQAKYSSLSQSIDNLSVSSPQQQALVQSIQTNQQLMHTVFDSTVVVVNNFQDQNMSIDTVQTLISRMAIQSQSLISDATNLAELLRNQADQLNYTNFILVFAIVGAFSSFLAVIYFQTSRRMLKSIADLRIGTARVGLGDLEYKLIDSKKDEIDELAGDFNQMTLNLKKVTASKAELEKEVEERKKAEEALDEHRKNLEKLIEERTKQLKDSERLATIGATAGMVGHDIRNPLQAITGDLYLVKTELDELPDHQHKKSAMESLDEIQNNIDYINKIVADLQDFARPLNPRAQETIIKTVINEIVIENNIPKNIKIAIEVDDKAARIVADPDYLKRIVSNLTLNAVQAMPEGGKLTIHVHNDKQTDDILITVKDTGVGIPEDLKAKLFTPMVTTKPKGQGFGLAVVKRMTEGLGGTVTFESQEGKGTTFIVCLPPPKDLNGSTNKI